jgi:hypothetical protein
MPESDLSLCCGYARTRDVTDAKTGSHASETAAVGGALNYSRILARRIAMPRMAYKFRRVVLAPGTSLQQANMRLKGLPFSVVFENSQRIASRPRRLSTPEPYMVRQRSTAMVRHDLGPRILSSD